MVKFNYFYFQKVNKNKKNLGLPKNLERFSTTTYSDLPDR